MNRSDLAEFLCDKLNVSETEDLAAAKLFLARRHEMIWNDQLWKESLVEYTATLSTTGYTVVSTWLPTKGILLLPPTIGRVLAVRTSDRALNAEQPEYYYRIDYDAFAKSGTPVQHIRMPACVWEFDTAKNIYARPASDADAGLAVRADLLDSDGTGVTRASVTCGDSHLGLLLGTSSRIDTLRKKASNGAIYVTEPLTPAVTILTFAAADTSMALRQRLRLVEIPDTDVTIRVLGKRTCPTFTADEDEPGLPGIDNCLLSFAQCDMLQRDRHYAKAQAVAQEAVMLLEQFKALETVQQSHHQRIIPENGYRDDYGPDALRFHF